jgi:hypothetical protein
LIGREVCAFEAGHSPLETAQRIVDSIALVVKCKAHSYDKAAMA